MSKLTKPLPVAPAVFCCTCVVLAFDPLLWLFRSWSAPGYDSPGALVFVCVGLLFAWSLTSPLFYQATPRSEIRQPLLPVALLICSLIIRLLSQILAINVLGALLLALDVFALGLLFRLQDRKRAVNPLLLAGLFCFALPLEPLLQRSLGFVLQQASAFSACSVLGMFYTDVSCVGVRIILDGVDVLVDLPCSGARVLILLLTAFFALAALRPMSAGRVLASFCFTVALALVANTARILLLAIGLRYQVSTGINVMLDPWHSGIGLCVAAASILTLLLWMHCQPTRFVAMRSPQGRVWFSEWFSRFSASSSLSVAFSVLAFMLALKVVSATPQPLDVSAPLAVPELPLTLNGFAQTPLALNTQEQQYFAAYGGAAARAGYGDSSLLFVRTTSPLRHLHTPDVCFSAAGYDVTYVGAEFSTGAEAVYRAQSPTGVTLRIGVRFMSDSGLTVHSIGEVVWHWLRQPGEAWTMVQTVTHLTKAQASHADQFIAAVTRSLNFKS